MIKQLPSNKRAIVEVSRHGYRRLRFLLGLSLVVNLLCCFGLAYDTGEQRYQKRLTRWITEIGEASQELSQLYEAQVQTLSAAYASYGRSLKADGKLREQLYNNYQNRMQAFQQRSTEMARVTQEIEQWMVHIKTEVQP